MKQVYDKNIHTVGSLMHTHHYIAGLVGSKSASDGNLLAVDLKWLFSTNKMSPRDFYLAAYKVPVLVHIGNQYIFRS